MFYAVFKKSHLPRFLKIISSTRLNRSMHSVLSQHGRKTLTELGHSILGRQIFDTAEHFRFQCETSRTNMASYVNDISSFKVGQLLKNTSYKNE